MGGEGEGRRGWRPYLLAGLMYVGAAACQAAEAGGVPMSVHDSGGAAPVLVSALDTSAAAPAPVVPEAHAPEDQVVPSPELATSEAGDTDPSETATVAAVADGVTTAVALSAGAIEMNPLVATSPAGLVALTGLKIGLVKYAETLPEEEKRTVMKTSSALWMGAAVNNILVIVGAANPAAVVVGIVAGVLTWQHVGDKYQEHDRMVAARRAGTTQATAVVPQDELASAAVLAAADKIYIN